ncbi:MAG: M2 family metallopeptidase [Gemmatimonadetes bacterium]|nr:M2 family metallopeptidase [Gemmatimonadota bacterium]
MRPHHYPDPFFQEAPPDEQIDLDRFFLDRDVVAIARDFYAGIGLPVEEILVRSDLYEREGKDQHAYCLDVDREGDVRILCNVVPGERWMQTMLHELGHAVYDWYLPRSLPFLVRRPAHLISTEAIALLFGRLTRDHAWLTETLRFAGPTTPGSEILTRERRRAMLIFLRWSLVMVYFEREFYANPEREDLNRLWWDLVGELQQVRPPARLQERHDWATKIHVATAPVYYHNYLLGELQASQFAAFISANVLADGSGGRMGYVGRPEVGEYLRERVFAPGAVLDWNGLSQHATGKPLGPEGFVLEFVGE